HRSLLANPARAENLGRLNDVKGREHFRPIAPVVLEERAAGVFAGQLPSPYMLFTHRVLPEWRPRIPAVVPADGSARAPTGPRPGLVVLVDDRRRPDGPLPGAGITAHLPVRCVAGPGAGPAAARNAGWRQAQAEWVVFLDDDVLPAHDWPARLVHDLARLGP